MADREHFLKFRRKAQRDSLLKIGIISVSVTAGVVGGILLAAKLLSFSMIYCLFGLVALPVCLALSVMALWDDDERLARRMDREMNLNERVQTMLAFSDSDECIPGLQRQDTEERLAAIPARQLTFSGLAFYILFPVLTLGLLTGAILLPAGAEEGTLPVEGPEETETQSPPREITEWEWQALDELIQDVRESEADGTIMKPRTLEALEDLRELLQNGVSEDSFSGIVGVTVTQINNAEVDANEQFGMTDYQKGINTEVAQYTIKKLYEIFDMSQPEDPDQDPDDGSEETSDPNQSWDGTGDVVMGANERLFDADRGYVSYTQVIGTYYNEVLRAFREGVLTEADLEEYMMTYFKYLYGTEQE